MLRFIRLLILLTLAAAPMSARAGWFSADPLVWSGGYAHGEEASTLVARDETAWAALWDKIGKPAPQPLPQGKMAVAVFLGQRRTGGYGVAIEDVVPTASGLTVFYRETKPAFDHPVTMVITAPYTLRLLPLSYGNVTFMAREPVTR